jgi:uncharacterized protein
VASSSEISGSSDLVPMRVLLAGGSGLIGDALARSLIADGHLLRRLVRRPARDPAEVTWAPEQGELPPAALDGVDAVVCLSGADVGAQRWTPAYKATLRESRVTTVGTLAEALARAEIPPATFISASAVGYYGDTGPVEVAEDAASGSTFLAGVCRDWEQAAQPAVAAGVRVAHLRTGLVLARGGLLARMTPLFRLGVGGRLGGGRQYWPWISLADEIGAIRFLMERTDLDGPVNLTAPTPVTNREFTEVLANVLHRPAVLPVPEFALRIALGEFAGEVVISQRVVPGKLTAAGYEFQHRELAGALRAALAR